MGALAVLIFCLALLYAQHAHYRFKESERDHVDAFRMSDALEKKLQAFDELKARVDTLALKVGLR